MSLDQPSVVRLSALQRLTGRLGTLARTTAPPDAASLRARAAERSVDETDPAEPFSITMDHLPQETLITVAGAIDPPGAARMAAAAATVLRRRIVDLTFAMGAVSSMDAAGLRVLDVLHHQLEPFSRRVRIEDAPPIVEQIMATTRLDQRIAVVPQRDMDPPPPDDTWNEPSGTA